MTIHFLCLCKYNFEISTDLPNSEVYIFLRKLLILAFKESSWKRVNILFYFQTLGIRKSALLFVS